MEVALYKIGIALYLLAVRIASLFKPKARLFLEGRKNLLPNIKKQLEHEARPRIWVHCASLGEFEQGRPIIESIRKEYPQYAIIVTFFSPSGYEPRKNYSGADYVFYLPVDNAANAKQFIEYVNPTLCLFVKYELWFYLLKEISRKKIPCVLISAIFTERHGFFKWYGGLQRRMLKRFDHIFVQDITSKKLLESIHIKHVSVSGDTRFDRVADLLNEPFANTFIEKFCGTHKVIVAGSTWREDEQFLKKLMAGLSDEWRLLLIPHEIDKSHLHEIKTLFGDCSFYTKTPDASSKVLVIDTVGMLSKLYRYATITWIGGAFGKEGVHNVLEAAVYGKPVYFGPVYHQFLEAQGLIDAGGALSVAQPAQLLQHFEKYATDDSYQKMCAEAADYVRSNTGATLITMKGIAGWLKQ